MQKDIRTVAMDLLARREHSQFELRQKLKAREFDNLAIDTLLGQLIEHGYQSDERYAESYVASRIRRGYGPLKISMELKARGVSDTLIKQALDFDSAFWLDAIEKCRIKRFGDNLPEDYEIKMKQMHYLETRGFTHDQIRQIF